MFHKVCTNQFGNLTNEKGKTSVFVWTYPASTRIGEKHFKRIIASYGFLPNTTWFLGL